MVNMHGDMRVNTCIMSTLQAEKPEEDMDVRGGGQAHDDERRVKDHDDASDVEEDHRPGRDIPAEAPPPLVPPAVPAAAQEPPPVRVMTLLFIIHCYAQILME